MNRRGRGLGEPPPSAPRTISIVVRYATSRSMTVIEPWMISVDATIHHASILDSSLPPSSSSSERNDGPPAAVLSTAEIIYFFPLFFFLLSLENYQSHSCFLVASSCVFPISIRWIPVSLNTREKESKGNYNRKLVMERKEQIKEWLFPPPFVIRN